MASMNSVWLSYIQSMYATTYVTMNKGDQAIPMRNLTSSFCLFHGNLRESTEEGSTSSNRKENRNTFC